MTRFGDQTDLDPRTEALTDALFDAMFDHPGPAGEVAAQLLELGASPMDADLDGMTALMVAAKIGRADCVRILAPLSNVDAVDCDGWSAMSWAIGMGNEDCARILLPLIDLSLADSAGSTVAERARAMGLDELALDIDAEGSRREAAELSREVDPSAAKAAPKRSL